MNQGQDITESEKNEIAQLEKQFNEAPRFTRWRELYFDNDNLFKLNTFKNRTLSAIHAYDLNPNDPKQKKYAYELGSKNARKCNHWAQEYYESVGLSQEKILDIIAAKAISTNNAKYIQMLAELAGVYNPKAQVVVNNNNQNNIQADISEAEKSDFNEKFRRFIEQN